MTFYLIIVGKNEKRLYIFIYLFIYLHIYLLKNKNFTFIRISQFVINT